MAKKSSVEWLKKELEDYGSNSHLSLDWNTFDELCEQAKAMHKEEIEIAWYRGEYIGISFPQRNIDKIYEKNAEEYYNETYGGKDE